MKAIGLFAILLCLNAMAKAAPICSVAFTSEREQTTTPAGLELDRAELSALKAIEVKLANVINRAISEDPDDSINTDLLEVIGDRYNFFANSSRKLFRNLQPTGTTWGKQQFFQANTRALMDAQSLMQLTGYIINSQPENHRRIVVRALDLNSLAKLLMRKLSWDLKLRNEELDISIMRQEIPNLPDYAPAKFTGIEWEEKVGRDIVVAFLDSVGIDPSEVTSESIRFNYTPLYELFDSTSDVFITKKDGQLKLYGSLKYFVEEILNKTKIDTTNWESANIFR